MSERLQVALEFLKIGAKTRLPVEVHAAVSAIFDAVRQGERDYTAAATALRRAIQRNTGLPMRVTLHNGPAGPVMVSSYMPGHHGSLGSTASASVDIHTEKLMGKLHKLTIDLDNVQVKGLADLYEFELRLPLWAFGIRNPTTGETTQIWTVEEATAVVLHEIGHAFFTVATFGEYVWLNYFLMDGVDILLGKKPNTYQIQALNKTYLEKHLDDKALVETIRQQPTEANLRRAVLIAANTIARDHFNDRLGLGAYKRDEQLADLFVSRLGYGRALVTALDYPTKLGRTRPSSTAFYLLQALKMAWVPLGILVPNPIGIIAAAIVAGGGLWRTASQPVSRYDTEVERYSKLRRDLVAQLRAADLDPTHKEQLLADIKIIDGVLQGMHQHRSSFEVLLQGLVPARRRDYQRLKLEERLERLLHNDLFIAQATLKTRT